MPAHLFQCPACSAPLTPQGRASIVHCRYCHSAVEVPEALRQTSGVATWSTLVFESFVVNDNNWLVGDLPSEYFAKLTQAIADGRYRWEALVTLPSSMTTAWLTGYPLSDFHLMVNCKHTRGSRAGSSYGVLFRLQDNRSHYWFRISDSQFFAVSVVKEGEWSNLIDWTRSDMIKPYGVNQVEVIAIEKHFTFLINGEVVKEIESEHFSKGLVGLAIEGYTAGETIAFDFLDFVLRAP